MSFLPTETDFTTTAHSLATALPNFHSNPAVEKDGLALPTGSETCKSSTCYLCLVCRPRRRIIITIRIRRSAKYWAKVDAAAARARGEMGVKVGWRVRWEFVEGKEAGVEGEEMGAGEVAGPGLDGVEGFEMEVLRVEQ